MAMASGRIGTFLGIFFAFNLILGLIYLGLLLVIWILWGSGDNWGRKCHGKFFSERVQCGDDSKNMSMRELFSPILTIAGILLFIILMLAVLIDDWYLFFPACGVVLAVTGFFILLFYIEHSFKKKEWGSMAVIPTGIRKRKDSWHWMASRQILWISFYWTAFGINADLLVRMQADYNMQMARKDNFCAKRLML